MRWEPGLLLLHVVSDALIALAYFSIPLALIVFVRRRRDMHFGFIFWLFAAFILTCGITHIAAIVTLWTPDYWMEGVAKAVCAAVSVTTAVLLWPIIPKALRIPSPNQLQEANEKLQAANLELSRQVEENRRLAVEAQQSERAKEEFLAVMSHEVRTPLNAVLGMSSLLLDTPSVTREQEDYLRTIRSSGEALNSLVGNILDYTKLGGSETRLHAEPCQIVDAAATAMDLLAEQIEAAGLQFGIHVGANLPRSAQIDSTRFQQIILNLMRNAMKFTDEGDVVLSLSPATLENGVPALEIKVSDTGIGMDAAQQAELFRPFFQVERSLARAREGVGLGLAIVKRIVEMMGGKVDVQSEKNRGSTFLVKLPVTWLEEDAPQINRSILLVSGRPLFAECAASQLRHFGVRVMTACNSEEAGRLLGECSEVLVDYALGEEALAVRAQCGKSRCTLVGPVNRRFLTLDKSHFDRVISYPLRSNAFLDSGENAAGGVPNRVEGAVSDLRILVAEDNITNQKVVTLLLQKLGYKSQIVASGKEAVQAWKSSEFDLILMDVHMPELDGISACRMIREAEAREGRPACRIVALTADAHSGTINRCMAEGMNDVLTKPLKVQNLRDLLASIRKK